MPVEVIDEGGGAYSAVIDLGPDARPGDAVSLRVVAADDGGSSIDETIVNAYRVRAGR